MSDDFPSGSPADHHLFRFVESGMQLVYEFESIGLIKTALGHVIQFCPVLAVRGWSDHKECLASLRLKHFADQNREVGRCLVNQDEVIAWQQLLLPLEQQERGSCSGTRIKSFEYSTRHGIRMVWQTGTDWTDAPWLLYVSSMQPAVLPAGFVSQLLKIFADFESFCSRNE